MMIAVMMVLVVLITGLIALAGVVLGATINHRSRLGMSPLKMPRRVVMPPVAEEQGQKIKMEPM